MSTDNFVKTYDDCLSEDTCNEYIKQFELAKAASITEEHVPNVDRKDTSFLLVDLDQKLNDSLRHEKKNQILGGLASFFVIKNGNLP